MSEVNFYQIVGLGLVLVTVPLVCELLVLTVAALVPQRRARKNAEDHRVLPLAVVVPAHNEEARIGRCVRSLLSGSSQGGVEIIVVAHNCIDSTAAEAEAAGARILILNDPEQSGKGYALKCGFAAVLAGRAEAVLVIDADSVAGPSLLVDVGKRFLAGAQALQCRYQVLNTADSQRTRLMALAFQAFNVIRPRGRSRLGLSAGIFGNGFGLRRDVLARIPYESYSVVEDTEYHLALVRAGVRVEFVDSSTILGEMPLTSKGAEGQRARWEGGRFRLMRQVAPRLLLEILRGRIRLLEPLADLLALPIALEVVLLLGAALLPLAWVRLYVAGAFGVLLAHVGAAAVTGPGIWETIKVLATVPAYILWKLSIFPKIWHASLSNALWVRTERESPIDGQ